MQTVAQTRPGRIGQLDYLDFPATLEKPTKGTHGGYRPGAGRPKGSKSWKTKQQEERKDLFHKVLIEHVLGKEKVSYIDKNGNVQIKWRTRLEILLDALFRMAMYSPKFSDSLRAMREYLDRTMGKPGYMVDHYPTERLAREASERNRQEYLAAKEAMDRPVSRAQVAAAIAYHKTIIQELEKGLERMG